MGAPKEEDLVAALPANFRCSVCLGVLNAPVQVTACQHVFCEACLNRWFQSQQARACPECRTAASREDPVPHRFSRQMLEEVMVFCSARCGWEGHFSAQAAHHSRCRRHLLHAWKHYRAKKQKQLGLLEAKSTLSSDEERELARVRKKLQKAGDVVARMEREGTSADPIEPAALAASSSSSSVLPAAPAAQPASALAASASSSSVLPAAPAAQPASALAASSSSSSVFPTGAQAFALEFPTQQPVVVEEEVVVPVGAELGRSEGQPSRAAPSTNDDSGSLVDLTGGPVQAEVEAEAVTASASDRMAEPPGPSSLEATSAAIAEAEVPPQAPAPKRRRVFGALSTEGAATASRPTSSRLEPPGDLASVNRFLEARDQEYLAQENVSKKKRRQAIET